MIAFPVDLPRLAAMRAALKFTVFSLWLLLMVLVCLLPWALHLEALRRRLVSFTFRVAVRLLGLRVIVHGPPATQRPLLVVSNHSSYADIYALGAVMPVSFTPKSDIKSWPFINLCCYVSGCVFIERKASKMQQVRQEIASRLRMGRPICLFAEGTTSNGTQLKPFKSGFFSLAEGIEDLFVQPVTIAYTHINGQAINAQERLQIAWIDDTALLPHFWHFLSFRSVTVQVVCHAPVRAAAFDSRKALCLSCETEIAHSLQQQLAE